MQVQNEAFALLQELERRSLIHAVGLPEQEEAADAWTGVGFRLHGEPLVAAIDEIAEIMPIPPMTPVPMAQPWIRGLANVRGTLIPIIDLHLYLFGVPMERNKRSRVVVARHESGDVGLLVEEMLGQRHFTTEDETETPVLPEPMQPLVEGALVQGESVWARIHFDRLFEQDRFMQAAA